MPFTIKQLDNVLDGMISKAEKYSRRGNVPRTEAEMSRARAYANDHNLDFQELRGRFAIYGANVTAFNQTRDYVETDINHGRIISAYRSLQRLANYAKASHVPELEAETVSIKNRLGRFIICECYARAA